MKFIADFHIHSHYSIATSKKLTPEHLDYWARLKGINVIGTGDCVHPGWLNELKEKLQPAGNGLFVLKESYRLNNLFLPDNPNMPEEVFFMLTGEISTIYKKGGKVRKVHNLCIFPDFQSVEKLQGRLIRIGNITSDGRPILGMDSKFLLELVLESSPESYLIPAHIWTPWFSVLGSKSGFDSLEECFEDLTENIFAVETGLSSDPPMNRVCGFLDRYKLISNSDAHSPEKLGREANLFDTEISYKGIFDSLKGDNGFEGTIEFFPQEGKYHYDGHRKCDICWDPLETVRNKGICPKCGRPVTKGVMYRVAELADRKQIPEDDELDKIFFSITALPDILCQTEGYKNPMGKAVQQSYLKLIQKLGSEFHILLKSDLNEIKACGGEILYLAIDRLRKGEVEIQDGYDGEFGKVTILKKEEIKSLSSSSLFLSHIPTGIISRKSLSFDINEFKEHFEKAVCEEELTQELTPLESNEDDQQMATQHLKGPCMVLAGPGSGKTRVLTERIAYLINEKQVDPSQILAITFSNKAAREIRERVNKILNGKLPLVLTFHSLGLTILKDHYEKVGRRKDFTICDELEKEDIYKSIDKNRSEIKKEKKLASQIKQGIIKEEMPDVFKKYQNELKIKNAFDLDDLIFEPINIFKENCHILKEYKKKFDWILIDEYQDINASQYELIRLLAGEREPNLFVIGDPDQAIYGFRGSDVRFIRNFKTDYADAKIILLKRSFRCPENILKVAGQVLGKKEYLAGHSEDLKAHIHHCQTDRSEADWIAAKIENMMGGVRSFSMDSGISDGVSAEEEISFSDFAVLCRTSFMFKHIQSAFENHGIAYQITDTEPFYQKPPLSDVIHQMRIAYKALMEGGNLTLNKEGVNVETFQMMEKGEEIIKIIIFLLKNSTLSFEDEKKIELLTSDLKNDYRLFFEELSMRKGMDDFDAKREAVSIMTIHASKGLEFNHVFIPGCEEGIMPFTLFGNKNKEEISEEERLFYVGITRTRKNLFLSHSDIREINGVKKNQNKSHFLERMEEKLLNRSIRETGEKKRNPNEQLSLFEE